MSRLTRDTLTNDMSNVDKVGRFWAGGVLLLVGVNYIIPSFFIGETTVALWNLDSIVGFFVIPIHLIFFLFVGLQAFLYIVERNPASRSDSATAPVSLSLLLVAHVIVYAVIPIIYHKIDGDIEIALLGYISNCALILVTSAWVGWLSFRESPIRSNQKLEQVEIQLAQSAVAPENTYEEQLRKVRDELQAKLQAFKNEHQ